MADEVLKDIESIVVDRPDLNAEEWDIVAKARDWMKATLRPEVRQELDVEYAKKNDEFQEELRKQTTETVNQRMEEWKANQKPLDKEEISILLAKEYIEFSVHIRVRGEDSARNFTIIELPMEAEERFMKVINSKLVSLLEKVNASEWKLDGSIAEKLQGLLENIPEAMEGAKEIVAICLDPWQESKDINPDWVKKNLSIYRISNIIIAQVEANKYRDFFSNGFRLSRSPN
jgi:hypothetical protein